MSLRKFTIIEFWDQYTETKKILEDYSLEDFVASLMQEEVMKLTGGSGIIEEDRGSHQDQAPEDFMEGQSV